LIKWKDTGGCADIFAFIKDKIDEYQKNNQKDGDNNQKQDPVFDQELLDEIEERVKQSQPTKTKEENLKVVENIVNCFNYMHLITIVELESSENIDEAILCSLLEGFIILN
jgi:hypothetical protein